MMKATGLKRGSRKKQQPQQPDMDKDDPPQRPVSTVVKQLQCIQPQQQPPPQQPMQSQQPENLPQNRRPNEEVAALTTKNYRLAKELVSVIPCHAMLILFLSPAENNRVSF
jgi:hypothetical protein